MENGKVLIQFEVPIKQSNTTSADVHAKLEAVLQDWTEYINNNLTNNVFFDKVKITETKIEGAKDGNQLELSLKNH
jgi:hypothetical protein